jgi:hypothetical protein
MDVFKFFNQKQREICRVFEVIHVLQSSDGRQNNENLNKRQTGNVKYVI